MVKTNCSKCGTAILAIGPPTQDVLCVLCGTDAGDYAVSTDVTVPKSLLVECAVLASSYEALADQEPYAGRDPQKAADLKRQIDAILEAAR